MMMVEKELLDNLQYSLEKANERIDDLKAVNRCLKEDCVELEKDVKMMDKIIETSGGLKCPNCEDDQGWTTEQDGRGEWYQLQCEFCWTVHNSVFNRRKRGA